MNLRILKKLSKRAAPLLSQIGDHRKQFPAIKDDNYTGILISARKHFERGRSVHPNLISEGEIKRPAKDGVGWVYMNPPAHPRKGTIMVGATTGYYEPEWDEETAWEALREIVCAYFTDWCCDEPKLLRVLRTPKDIFAAAQDIPRSRSGGRKYA